MLLKQFKGTGPATIFFIVVLLLSLWSGTFANLKSQFSWYFDLNPMPLYGLLSDVIGTNPMPGIIFTLLLVSLMAFLMVNLNTTLFFINERTFLPAILYIMLSGLFPQFQILNPAIMGAVFLMMAVKRIMDAYRVQGTAYNFYDAGFLISAGSLFYANLIWFGVLPVIGILLLRSLNVKELFLSLLGLLTPIVITTGIYYASGEEVMTFLSLFIYNLFEKQSEFVFTPLTIVALIFFGSVTLTAISHLFVLMNTKKIQSRKTFYLLLWILAVSLAIYFMVSSVSVEIIWIIAIPAGYLLTHYFVFSRKRVITEIVFFLLLLLIVLVQIWERS